MSSLTRSMIAPKSQKRWKLYILKLYLIGVQFLARLHIIRNSNNLQNFFVLHIRLKLIGIQYKQITYTYTYTDSERLEGLKEVSKATLKLFQVLVPP